MLERIPALIHFLTTHQVCVPSNLCSDDSWKFPLLLVLWSLALALIALGAGLHLYWQTRHLRRIFLRLADTLQNIRAPSRSMTKAGFEQVDTCLRKEPLTRAGWSEFQETVLREEKKETGAVSVFNTHPAAEFFPHSEVEQRISAYHRLMPTALTSLGLLGTFLALLIGLHDVRFERKPQDRSATVEQAAPEPGPQLNVPPSDQSLPAEQVESEITEIKGIDKLVGSLSGKFLSSIVALILSVFYAIGEAFLIRRASEAHQQFCAAFDALFVRRTSEWLLQQIHREIESQSAAFRHFNTDLSGYLKQSFQESLGPTLSRLTEALERMTSTNEDRIAQLVGSLTETFRSNLTESAKTEFQQLAQSLKQTAELLEEMNKKSQSSQEGLENLLRSLGDFQRRQGDAAEYQRGTMEALFIRAADQLNQTVIQLIQRTEASSKDTAAELTRILAEHARTFEEKMGTLLARLDTIVVKMGQSTQSGSEQLLAAVGEVIRRLEQAVATAATAMQGATAGVVQTTGDVSEQLSGQIRQLLAQQDQQVQAVKQAHESLEQATERTRTLLKDTGEAFGQIQPLISDLVATTRDLRSVGEVARSAQNELQQVSVIFAQQGTLLKQTTDQHTALLGQFQSVFKTVEQGLGSILHQIGEGMRGYQEASRKSLKDHIGDFDNHLATVTQQIKVSIEGICPGLEDLAEAIDSAAKQIGGNGKTG